MTSHDVSLGAVIERMTHDLVAGVLTSEGAALADLPDGVHKHRTKVRRLRAVLAATRRLRDPGSSAALQLSLREWGRHLGEVRDAEVRAELAEAALSDAGSEDERARDRLVIEERAGHDRLHARLVELHELPRTHRLADDLRRFGAAPGVIEPQADAAQALGELLRREARRVRSASGRIDGSLERYHDLRKAGRRLRYVASAVDAAAPGLFGETAVRLSKAGKRVHDILGDHRDLLMFAERLERARTRAVRAGEPAELYGGMLAVAVARAADRLAELERAAKRVRKAASALG